MSGRYYAIYAVVWIISLVECKIPEVRVTCIFSEGCILPCSFEPNVAGLSIEWYQQEELILSFRHTEETFNRGSVTLFRDQISHGNASLLVPRADIRHKGRYKCVVDNNTRTYVLTTVEAPIKMISIDSKSSGLIQCSTKDVYPAPVLQWTTESSLPSAALQPMTRITPDEKGLYSVESTLKLPNNSFNHIFVCTISSKYGTQTLTASLQLQEMTVSKGQDLVIPCKAPKNLQFSTLVWTFTRTNKSTEILTYDSRTNKINRLWNEAEMEKDNALEGDGSLVLEKPVGSENSGIYTCAFSGLKTKHLTQTRVDISSPSKGKDSGAYKLWMLGIVGGLLALLAVTLLIKKYNKGKLKRRQNAQEDAEMQNMNTGKTLEEPQAGSRLMTGQS